MPKGEATSGLIPLNERSKEERKRISRMGVETRRRNKEEKLMLQKCMRELLNMRVNSNKRKEVLKKFGFSADEDLDNKTLLMVSLFQKGISGDVTATKEIVSMMDKLDMFEKTGKIENNVTINLVSSGEEFEMSEEQLEEIERIEGEEDEIND